MKGLFIKDFEYLKDSKLLFVFLVIFGLLMSYFNESPYFILGYFSVFASLLLAGTLNYDDYNSSLVTTFILPISKREYIKQKYLLGLLLGGFLTTLAILCTSIIQYILTNSLAFINLDFFIGCFLTLLFSYFIISIFTPVAIKLGSQESQKASILVFCSIFIIGFIIYYGCELLGIDIFNIIDNLAINYPTISIVGITCFIFLSYLLSYSISLKILTNKEL